MLFLIGENKTKKKIIKNKSNKKIMKINISNYRQKKVMFLPKILIKLKNLLKVLCRLMNKFLISRMKLILKILLIREISLLNLRETFYILKVCQASIMGS